MQTVLRTNQYTQSYSLGKGSITVELTNGVKFIFMKKYLISHFVILVLTIDALGQTPCSNIKVISPIVPEPTGASIISATCSTLVVQWNGYADQNYIANVSFYNTAAKKRDTTFAAGTCNGSQVCTATLPVSEGAKISWSVQAEQIIDGRAFYSYYLIGDRDYRIPGCIHIEVTKTSAPNKNEVGTNSIQQVPSTVGKLIAYPNPATNEITIQWSSGYKGSAVVAISDATGKEVKLLRVSKEGSTYINQIPIGNLVAGLYYVQVKPQQSGKPLTEKFLKQ